MFVQRVCWYGPSVFQMTDTVQANTLCNPRDEDRVLVHGFRNSARVWMFSLKQPPRAVVLVWELVSITPRDLTQ